MSVESEKKARERAHVERFLAVAEPSYRIEEQRERPDFIIGNGTRRVGLEHCYAAEDNLALSQRDRRAVRGASAQGVPPEARC
jgi:hypothetical protein